MLANRREKNSPIQTLHVYYHIACMNDWWTVVREQLGLLKHVGLTEVNVSILGQITDALAIQEYATSVGIHLSVDFVSPYLRHYETPTLASLWRKSLVCDDQTAFLYLHTKGVSNTGDAVKVSWRRAMQKYTVANFAENLNLLREYCIVGANWQHSNDYPHYQGNFWLARADWLRHLPDPEYYRRSRDFNICGNPWERMHAEMWLGSLPYHHMYSHCGSNLHWWIGENFPDCKIEGFDYDT